MPKMRTRKMKPRKPSTPRRTAAKPRKKKKSY